MFSRVTDKWFFKVNPSFRWRTNGSRNLSLVRNRMQESTSRGSGKQFSDLCCSGRTVEPSLSSDIETGHWWSLTTVLEMAKMWNGFTKLSLRLLLGNFDDREIFCDISRKNRKSGFEYKARDWKLGRTKQISEWESGQKNLATTWAERYWTVRSC